MLSAFQLIMPAQLSVSQIMPPNENFVKDALVGTVSIRMDLSSHFVDILVGASF